MLLRKYRILIVMLLTSLTGVIPCYAEVSVSQGNHVVKTDYNHILVDLKTPSELLTAYSFNDINEALRYVFIRGLSEQVTIYLASGEHTVSSINCNNVLLKGLSENRDDIIIRRAYGTAEIRGTCNSVENVTIEDFLYGDMIHYRNCNVITPPRRIEADTSGRILYENCNFECYDDALKGNSVYVNCKFDLYSGAPVYESAGKGTTFMDCRFNTYFSDVLYLTGRGRVTLVDCNFTGDCSAIFWTINPKCSDRYYQNGVTLRGNDYIVSNDSLITVDMSGLRLAEAYSFMYRGDKQYNIYNLLHGEDGWDPLQQEKILIAASSFYGRSFTGLQTELNIDPDTAIIKSKKDIITFQAKGISVLGWNVTDERLRLIPGKDNNIISLTLDSDSKEHFFSS